MVEDGRKLVKDGRKLAEDGRKLVEDSRKRYGAVINAGNKRKV